MSLALSTEKAIIQQLQDPLFEEKGVMVFIKREDLIHPQVSGNKWRKLKYNLQQAKTEKHTQLLTFGGAYSNHILATAAAGKLAHFETIGVIRGEEHLPLNSTLAFAKSCGMQLHYLDRSTYRQKHLPDIQTQLMDQFGSCYIIPEGGSNLWAVKGCSEMVKEIDIPFDYICAACGTGGTLAGIIAGLEGKQNIIGIPVLKGANFLYEEIESLLKQYNASTHFTNWELHLNYHFGGYAKNKPELKQFILDFQQRHHIDIEFVYTAKLFWGIYDLIKNDYFQPETRIMAIHTGGLRNF